MVYAMGNFTVTPLHDVFAAEVEDLDLRQQIDAAVISEIATAMDTYGVLIFRDQDLSVNEQMAFTRAFGSIDMGLLRVVQKKNRFANPGMIDISNVDGDRQVLERDDPRLATMLANQLWHSDSSFKMPSAKYSLLFACVLPKTGGETEFADARAAYDALPASTVADLDGLFAEHSAFHSRQQLGDQQYSSADVAKYPSVKWPLVRTHPGSGRKVLFIGAHACKVTGQSVPEGRLLLNDLLEHATQRQFVYRHSWMPGDLVMWDNRAVLHRGRRYDLSRRRELRRSTVADVAN